jgi:NADP-dependent 3-hydroxy acid dehydrogenase YdfG
MKTILITGASTGIGKETAIYFAKNGWNVSATMRTPKTISEFGQFPNIKVVKLDVLDEESIDSAIQSTIQEFGAIDVVFNNAGYGLVGVFEAMTQEQIRKQFDTNLFGLMNVTRAILPYFRQRREGTIINTSSMGGLITFPLYSAYHGTKWAVEGFSESLQFELKKFNIKVKNIEPGAIKTEFADAIEFVSHPDYDSYAEPTHHNMLKEFKNAPDGKVVAKVVFKAANDTSFRLRYPVGNQSPLLLFLRRLLPNSIFFALIRMVTEKSR